MEQTKLNPENQVKTQEGLLTRNVESLLEQVWNMENTVFLLEQTVDKLRSPEKASKISKDKSVEPISIYEKYTHLKDRVEILNRRLSELAQNLTEIV